MFDSFGDGDAIWLGLEGRGDIQTTPDHLDGRLAFDDADGFVIDFEFVKEEFLVGGHGEGDVFADGGGSFVSGDGAINDGRIDLNREDILFEGRGDVQTTLFHLDDGGWDGDLSSDVVDLEFFKDITGRWGDGEGDVFANRGRDLIGGDGTIIDVFIDGDVEDIHFGGGGDFKTGGDHGRAGSAIDDFAFDAVDSEVDEFIAAIDGNGEIDGLTHRSAFLIGGDGDVLGGDDLDIAGDEPGGVGNGQSAFDHLG